MSQEWIEDDLRKAVESVIKKSASDATFKQLALTNPAAAFKDVTKRELPSGMKIEMIEAGEEMHGHVQYTPADSPDELLDADLEKVAGGQMMPGLDRLGGLGSLPGGFGMRPIGGLRGACAAIGGDCPCGSGRSLRV
jgi:hypothetical protein